MLLEIVIVWPAIYGTLIGAILLSFILYFIRSFNHKKTLKKIQYGCYEEVLLKLKRMLVRPFPAMLGFEREKVFLEIAITSLLIYNYTDFSSYIEKVSANKLNYLKQVWKALYSYQIGKYDDFEKYKSYFNTIYSKFTSRYALDYSPYNELLEELSKNHTGARKEALEQIMNKITKNGGILLKEYIKQILLKI